jgi:hypothetical protein
MNGTSDLPLVVKEEPMDDDDDSLVIDENYSNVIDENYSNNNNNNKNINNNINNNSLQQRSHGYYAMNSGYTHSHPNGYFKNDDDEEEEDDDDDNNNSNYSSEGYGSQQSGWARPGMGPAFAPHPHHHPGAAPGLFHPLAHMSEGGYGSGGSGASSHSSRRHSTTSSERDGESMGGHHHGMAKMGRCFN